MTIIRSLPDERERERISIYLSIYLSMYIYIYTYVSIINHHYTSPRRPGVGAGLAAPGLACWPRLQAELCNNNNNTNNNANSNNDIITNYTTQVL